MSVEMSVYTQQTAMSGLQLRELAGRRGLELRLLDLAGKPLGTTERLDVPLSGRDYVLIDWPAEHAETTAAVEQALGEGDKSAIDRLGMSGKLGWCQMGCGDFDFEEYEAALKEGLEEDEELVPAEVLERMRQARTEYSFRCGTRPRQCAALLERVASMIREATDGFDDE
jgi:hypothetical protein